jgi:hypothetical protein
MKGVGSIIELNVALCGAIAIINVSCGCASGALIGTSEYM